MGSLRYPSTPAPQKPIFSQNTHHEKMLEPESTPLVFPTRNLHSTKVSFTTDQHPPLDNDTTPFKKPLIHHHQFTQESSLSILTPSVPSSNTKLNMEELLQENRTSMDNTVDVAPQSISKKRLLLDEDVLFIIYLIII
jgi:hypothetical protein